MRGSGNANRLSRIPVRGRHLTAGSSAMNRKSPGSIWTHGLSNNIPGRAAVGLMRVSLIVVAQDA